MKLVKIGLNQAINPEQVTNVIINRYHITIYLTNGKYVRLLNVTETEMNKILEDLQC